MYTKKGQASLEFLTTYGWMFMVAATVAAALAYFGVFSPENNLPQQCTFGYDFSCNQYVIHANGSVAFTLANKIGEPLEALSITCVYGNSESHGGTIPANTWGAGDTMAFNCTPMISIGGLDASEREVVDVHLEYQRKSGGFVKTVQGKIAADVVDRS